MTVYSAKYGSDEMEACGDDGIWRRVDPSQDTAARKAVRKLYEKTYYQGSTCGVEMQEAGQRLLSSRAAPLEPLIASSREYAIVRGLGRLTVRERLA
jgi:hypothetical protein